jgi:hypothetical protein
MSAPMPSILADEFRLQSLKQTDQFPDETTLEDGVVVEVRLAVLRTIVCADRIAGGSVLAFQRDPAGPNGERQVSSG